MILTGDRFYPNAENFLSILILQFVLFMHVFHLLYFVSNDNNKDVQSYIYLHYTYNIHEWNRPIGTFTAVCRRNLQRASMSLTWDGWFSKLYQ